MSKIYGVNGAEISKVYNVYGDSNFKIYDINGVELKVVTGITVTYTGGDVKLGTTLDKLEGLKVVAKYLDGSSEEVFDYTLSGGDITTVEKTFTVTYQGKIGTFKVRAYNTGSMHKLVIKPTPSDATVIIDGVVQNNITVVAGTFVDWVVSKEGYITQSGTKQVTIPETLNITLVEE